MCRDNTVRGDGLCRDNTVRGDGLCAEITQSAGTGYVEDNTVRGDGLCVEITQSGTVMLSRIVVDNTVHNVRTVVWSVQSHSPPVEDHHCGGTHNVRTIT